MMTLAEVRWWYIEKVLRDCGGNVSAAARILDIPQKSLQRLRWSRKR
jgi:two-component system response regulator RegA